MNANELKWNVKNALGQRLFTQTDFDTIPREEQEGKISDRMVHIHLFCGWFDWFITDLVDLDEGLFFGWVANGIHPECSEWGYISLAELARLNVNGLCVQRNGAFTVKRAGDISGIDCFGD